MPKRHTLDVENPNPNMRLDQYTDDELAELADRIDGIGAPLTSSRGFRLDRIRWRALAIVEKRRRQTQ